MPILVSACLLGVRCRYDGAARPCPAVLKLAESETLIPVCPEQLGGLPTPREPAEIKNGRAVTASGRDVTESYERGAEETLRLARLYGCRKAILKERSPSCGCRGIYDGSFTGTLVPGRGFTAALLSENGVAVCGESDPDALM
ncbi:MAG: DUF523 domain-containing protein [Oscillospiraceae bacterium]|nr:DUF523 domain-containing protein [Oscillospiraceae bacterium]